MRGSEELCAPSISIRRRKIDHFHFSNGRPMVPRFTLTSWYSPNSGGIYARTTSDLSPFPSSRGFLPVFKSGAKRATLTSISPNPDAPTGAGTERPKEDKTKPTSRNEQKGRCKRAVEYLSTDCER